MYKVRTLEKFSVEKNEAKEIIIDDRTEVVKIGESDDKALHISELLKNDALLRIENCTTYDLYDVRYGGSIFSDGSYRLPINEYDIRTFDSTRKEFITFEFGRSGYVKTKVRTAEKILLKKGTSRLITLTDTTMVVEDGKNTPVKLSSLY